MEPHAASALVVVGCCERDHASAQGNCGVLVRVQSGMGKVTRTGRKIADGEAVFPRTLRSGKLQQNASRGRWRSDFYALARPFAGGGRGVAKRSQSPAARANAGALCTATARRTK